eukprot:4440892-Amphidinium_carterae.1
MTKQGLNNCVGTRWASAVLRLTKQGLTIVLGVKPHILEKISRFLSAVSKKQTTCAGMNSLAAGDDS